MKKQTIKDENDLTDYLKGFDEEPVINDNETDEPVKRKRGRPKGSTKNNVINDESNFISGNLLLIFIDLIIPTVISIANNRFSNDKISGTELKLTNEQMNNLKPLANEVANMISVKGNPVIMLTISLVGIYITNYMILKHK